MNRTTSIPRSPPLTAERTDAVRLQEGWNVLAGQASGRSGFSTLELAESVSAGSLLQAVDREGAHHLLIPVAGQDGPEDRLSAGVTVTRTVLEDAGGNEHYGVVRCELSRLEDLFDDVLLDMINAAAENPDDAVAACIAVLDEWRALLRNVRSKQVGRSWLAGLLAELHFVTEIVQRDPARRIDFWVGKEGQRHDLRRGHVAIEVKATMSSEGRRFAVHGLDQLVPPDQGHLYVAWARLERAPGGQVTLGGSIQRLRALGVPAQLIYSGLDERGLPPGASTEDAFELRETQWASVDEAFPRITRDSLRPGVTTAGISNVQYTVDLHASPTSLLDSRQVAQVLEAFARDE